MVMYRFTLPVLLGLMLLISPLHARLSVSLEQDTVELGKSLVLTVRSDQAHPDIENLVIPSPGNTFRIEPLPNGRSAENAVQQRQWRLYPLRTGTLTIPALHVGAIQSHPVTIDVTAPVDPRTGETFNVKIDMPKNQLWLRESAYLRMSLETSSPVVVLKRDSIEHQGVSITQLATWRERSNNNSGRYRHTTGWVIQPHRHGKMTIELPSIDFVRDGIITHRFYTPAIQMQVRPLPAYLPPGIPVGQPRLQSQLGRHWLFTDTLTHLQLRLSGKHMPPADLPSLRDQFARAEDLDIYPAREQQQTTTTHGVLRSVVDYEIPFRILSGGIHTLPQLRLDYFDPQQGKLVTRILPGITLYAIPRILFYLLLAVLAAGAWWLGRRYLPGLYRYLRRLFVYVQTVYRLQQVDNARQFRELLHQHAIGENWPANLTLARWLSHWQRTYGDNPQLAQIINDLQKNSYAGHPVSLSSLRAQLHQVLVHQRPLLTRLGLFWRRRPA